MRDYINIGSVPSGEDCQQVPYSDYGLMLRECKQYIEAIRKVVGQEPIGAYLKVKAFPHDFGTYHEVVCEFDSDNRESFEYALKCENQAPCTWSEVGMVAPTKDVKNDVVKRRG